jgi:hypothetical protein
MQTHCHKRIWSRHTVRGETVFRLPVLEGFLSARSEGAVRLYAKFGLQPANRFA